MIGQGQKVVVAMSGGVDSSAAALLLHEQGYQVVGVSMQVWDYRKNGGSHSKATCCAPADFNDARTVADYAGFPFYVFDFEEEFYEAVITPFVRAYSHGYTPNPCLDCNRKVKFSALRTRARSLGIGLVATGHYARILKEEDGTLGLYTSENNAKDQSYFLYAMTQEDLLCTMFPIGEMEKADVRSYLRSHGLDVANKAESQDICFVSSRVSEFVETEAKRMKSIGDLSGGSIVSVDGAKLGTHDGVHQFTVGQRKGLGIAHSEPLYVVNIDPQTRDVTVGPRSALEKRQFSVGQVNWISGRAPENSFDAFVKLRYRQDGVLCRVEPLADGSRAMVTFQGSDSSAVSPGQAAVFFSNSKRGLRVLGGGIIER